MGVDEVSYKYEFKYNVTLTGSTRISYLSIPKHAYVVSREDVDTKIIIESIQRAKKMSLYWRTANMLEEPHLVYAKNTNDNEIACVASLVPNFEPAP